MTQTVTSGYTLTEQIAHLGFKGVTALTDLTNCSMVMGGREGAGKSQFWQGCEHALILNLDNQPTSHPSPKASILPLRNADGVPVAPNHDAPSDLSRGTPIEMTWDWVLAVVDMLGEAAKEGVPNRPKMVVIDTADTANRLVEEWLVKEHNLRYSQNQKENFNDIDGRLAWPALRRQLVGIATKLRAAGYGVCYCIHLQDKIETNKDGTKTFLTNVPRLHPNTVNLLTPECEIVCRVERKIDKKLEKTGGKSKWVQSRVHKVVLADGNDAFPLKGRGNIPDEVELGPVNGYDDFHTIFTNALKETT